MTQIIEENMNIDDVIPNPKRNENRDYDVENFLPEYVRKGVTPTIASEDEVLYSDSSLEAPEESEILSDDMDHTILPDSIPEVGDYILMLDGKMVLFGEKTEILDKARAILYDEDVDYNLYGRNIDDLIVLKRVDLKYGVFIDD